MPGPSRQASGTTSWALRAPRARPRASWRMRSGRARPDVMRVARALTPPLDDAGIPLEWRHDPAHVARGATTFVDRLAVTKALTSVQPDHPELRRARERGVPLTSVQQLIADTAATRAASLIAVAGTHGKSTTTGWLIHLLTTAGLDPSGFVGALLRPRSPGARGRQPFAYVPDSGSWWRRTSTRATSTPTDRRSAR